MNEIVLTIIIASVIGIALAAVIVKMIRDKRKGKSSCGCGCSACPMSESCHSKSVKK